MSDTTSPATYTFTITLLTLPAEASAPAVTTWEVTGAAATLDRETYVITDAENNVVALAPLGAIIVRTDALLVPATTAATAGAA